MWVTARVTLVNRGNGQFDVRATPAGIPTYAIALGRFRAGSSWPDLVVTDADAVDRAHVYWNNSYGYWNHNAPYLLGGWYAPKGVAAGRINRGDTKIDFVLALPGYWPTDVGGIAVFVGKGDGTFFETPYFFCVDPDPSNTPKPQFVKIADMDQDGFNDVVTSNYETHNIGVLINALEAIPPGGG